MNARSHFVAVFFVLALIGGCKSGQMNLETAFDTGKDLFGALKPIPEEDEIAIGRDVAGQTLGAAPLVRDAALQAYVNRVGRWVALQSERPGLPWTFGVIDTGSINAFASPGGYILLTRGLYQLLDNEAQLAGVLGHEIVHVVEKHHITVMRKSGLLSAGTRVAQTTTKSGLAKNAVGGTAEIFARGLDKGAEFEADQRGIVLAARAGYNPFGLVEVLHKLQARSANDAAMKLLFDTHPSPTERLSKLGEAITPKIGSLPAGRQPPVRRIGAGAKSEAKP